MSGFIRPWDVKQQAEQEENGTQSKRSFFDNLRNAISAASANFDEVRGSEKLGDLRNELMDSQNISDDEYNQKRAEYVQKEYERQQARNQFMQAQQNLENDDSFLKNLTQVGGTVEGMAAQLVGTAGGAALGALASPFTAGGSIAMGAKIGNAAGAVAGGYLDARSVALQAEEEVLDAGGTWEQAKQAYDEALKKASLTTLPETLVDIAMGNRLVRAGLSSGVARKIAGSTLGRAGSAVLDPAARVGTKVSRMFNPLAGRAAGWATDVALQGATEAGQEVTQDYIADREVAKALGRQDNEYSLGGFGKYALSDQGLETMKTAGIMGAVFGGAGGALSSGQYLQKGSKYTSSNKIHAVTEKMINDGKLSLNEEQRQNEEKIISAFTGISPAQLSTWSDADIVAQSAEIRGEYLRKTSHLDETQDITGVRGFVDVINGVGDNQQQKAKTEGELTALSNSALEEYGITPEDRQKFFSTPTENTLLEKAKKELQKQTEQEKQNGEKPQTKIGLTPETAATMNIKGGTIDVKNSSAEEGGTTVLDMSQSTQRKTDGVTAEVKYKDNIGEKWQGFTEYTKDGQELEGKAYKNRDNGKVARITQGNDGAFYVLDTSEGNTQAQRFETLEQAESHLIKNQNNEKVFQSANQSETQEKRTLEKGEVDVDNGATGQHVSNVNDLFDFIQNNPDAISPEAFMEFVDMSRRIGTEGVDFYFDTKNKGYVKDDNGVYHQVRGWKQRRDESTGRALIQLYRGSDINTAVHEIAHVGYENLSKEDKKTFDTYAVKTMGRFIADLLNVNYDQNFRNRLLNLANDEELQKKINEQPAAFQAEIQLFLNGEVDINNLTEDQQRAIDERWAWEFTFWYMEGYVRGVEPKNIIQRLLNRSCIFLDKELKGIRRVWWHIHHKNSGAESLYRGTEEEPMNGDQQIAQQIQESEQTQQAEEIVQQPVEQQQYDYGVSPEEEQTQFTDSTGYATEEPFGTQKEYQNTKEEQYNNNEQNKQEEEPQLNLIMNDETAEMFADEALKRYGNNIEQIKSVLRQRYKKTKSREEKRWITKIVKIAELKYYNKWKNQDSNPRLDNVVDVEQSQVGEVSPYQERNKVNNNQIEGTRGIEGTQREGLTSRNDGYFNANPPQLNPAVMQETTVTPQVEEEFDANDTIEEENEGEENVVGDAIEEVAENIEQIYKTELEPQEIRDIEKDINEVLDGLENETDKTVKKISQSVGKRKEAAETALRKSNKETDKGQEVYKICSMSALKNVLDSRLKDNYYANGNVNQEKVNSIGNLIKKQLGEIYDDKRSKELDSDEEVIAVKEDQKIIQRLGSNNLTEANRIEKERKEAEKLAKKKQKKQAEVASQNLDILEQQIKNQQGEELTDDQLEEKLEKEITKDNVQPETKKGTKERKFTPEKGLERIRKIAKGSDGIAISKKELETYNKTGKIPEKVRQIREQQNKKKQQTNDIIEGWIDRLSKEEDYNEAMSQLQELLNSNAITEEEYNDISKGLEEHFEGEEDTGSKAEAVIFDDTAIDIITKFRQEEGKWKSEKVDNARNREIDKQKAQRKLEKKKNSDKRFMVHGKSAKGSPLTQEVLDKVEEEYNQKMQEKGISVIQNINMKLRNKAAENGIENVSDKNDPTFNDKYIQIHDEVNEYFWKKYKLFRGLDGEWRFWVSDDGAKLKVSGQDLANGAKFPKTFYSVFKLSEVLSHSKLFKNYPQLKNITVLPVWNRGDGTRGSFTAGEGGGGTIRINLAHPSFYSNETVDEEVIRVLLHEIQHAIQDIEGFAQGGEVSANFLKTKPAMNFILRNKGKLILSLADKLQKGVPSYIMKINGEDQKINLSFEENPISGDYNPVVTIGGKKIPSIKNKVLSELLISINNIKEDSVKLKESDFDSIAEYLNPKETEYLSKLFKMFDSGNFSLEFENKKLSKEESIQVAKERLSFLHDKKQLGKILEDYEYGSTLNEDFNVAIENSGLSYELYKSLLGEAEARNTAESYKNKYRKGQVPMTLEESYIKAKNGTGQLRINKKRFMYSSIPMEQEQKLENDFQSHAQSMGYPKWLIRKVSNYKGKDKETLLTNSNLNYNNKGKSIKFIDYLDKYNEIMIKEHGVKRELDGRWTREYSDKDSKAKEYFTRDKFLKDALSGGRKSFELQDVFTHNLMYKNNPYLQEMDILFADKQDMIRLNMSDRDWAEHKISDPKDGKEKIVINTEKYLKLSKEERLNQLRNDILHESQHAIQYHEGFSYSTDLLNKGDDYYWKAHSEIQARKTVQRADMTQDERNNKSKLLDEKLLNSGELKKTPITINDTKERSEQNVSYSRVSRENVKSSVEKNSGTNRSEGVQSSEKRTGVSLQGNKQDNVNNRRNISTKRFQKTNEKTPLEKAKEQRDARLEQQRKEGITSDFYKDVYSVSFTESAQQNEENKRKMEYFDKRKEYWDRNEKDGKVTYTRKTPFEHHQKVVTYNGINDVTKEQKKKSKPAQWAEWFKDQLIKYAFNDMHFLAKAARKLGVFDAYTKLVVTKGYALKANTAMERGIKYNGEYTRALNDIIKEVGEEKQHDFIEYCIAKRILDMKELRPEIRQKMSPKEAAELIEKYESGEDAELFKKNQKDFVKYNHALLHVLVDGGVMTEEEFQHHIKNDPNFVPLAKVMDDEDFGFNSIQAARSIVNVKSPIKKIGTSMREVKNPFLEMQKRTAIYYAAAARNKAGQIFVNEIAGKIDKLANGDTVARGQGMIRKVKIDEKDGKLITKPDEKQQIFYVCNNGKHEFYQVSDPEIYRALKALDADQMGTIQKMIDPFLHAPSALIRETATMVPDFGIRNLIRDGGEAFMTSEHGFLPFIDQIWGMYQMANNTEWYQRFLEQQGEYGTYNRDGANNDVARVEDTIDEKVNPIKNFNEIRRAAFEKFTNKKNSKATRAAALLQLMGSMPYAIIKSNKRINDYLEMGTRVGEFKNAKMGYNGTLDRLSKGGILDWDANINNAKQSDILAAGVAKEITLNFGQHGIIGKQLNRYIPFFNATLQGIYKMCNALELMATGKTLSGEKNHALQGELLFKAALVTAMAIGVAAAGEGDDDYEEANQYEKENFWILPNGLRFPKDQVLGKLFGNVAEKSYAQWRKGKFEPSDILRSIVENFTPDKFMPAMADITLGGLFNYDTFYKSAIVPEYMQGKLGHLQKDLSTSNMASDISDFLWKYTKTDVSAKRLDWALQKNLTNCKKYIDSLYDLGKQAYDPKSFNEKMARGYDKSDSTGAFVGGLKDDIPKPLSLVTGTFATNRTNYKSISDFYEKYNDLKKLATDEPSMSKEEKRAWKRYEQAYKKDKNFRKQLRAIKSDSSLTGKQKREKADKIFKQQIKLAKWAES